MTKRTGRPEKRGRGLKFLCLLCCLASLACSVAGAATGQSLFAFAAFVLIIPARLLPELMDWRESRAAVEAARRANSLSASQVVARVHVPARLMEHDRDGVARWPLLEIEWDSPSPSIH